MTKEEVLKAYKEKKTATINSFPSLTDDWSYFRQIESAIDEYYSDIEGVSKAFISIIRGVYTYFSKVEMQCENDVKLGIKYPAEVVDNYTSFENYWYAWNWVNESLADKIVFQTSTDTESGNPTKIVADVQPAYESIIAEIKSARTNEKALLDVLAERFWSSVEDVDLICLTEDRGKMIKSFSKSDIVKKIYIDYGAKEQIQNNKLNVYIPSYLR